VTVILVGMVAGFTIVYYATDFTVKYLALSVTGMKHVMIWQLLTYPFLNGCNWSLVWGGLLLLFIGSAVEREWRTKSFIGLWLIVSVVCGLIWVVISAIAGKSYVGGGTASCVYGIVAVFGVLYRRRRFLVLFWSVEAQHLAWAFIIIGIILGIRQPITWIWVAGALVGYLYVKLRMRMESAARRSPQSSYRPGDFVDID